jgi:hypothetical protein
MPVCTQLQQPVLLVAWTLIVEMHQPSPLAASQQLSWV